MKFQPNQSSCLRKIDEIFLFKLAAIFVVLTNAFEHILSPTMTQSRNSISKLAAFTDSVTSQVEQIWTYKCLELPLMYITTCPDIQVDTTCPISRTHVQDTMTLFSISHRQGFRWKDDLERRDSLKLG